MPITKLPQPLLFSIYKFLDIEGINHAIVTSKALSHSVNVDAFWAYLVKRDLTERHLNAGETYKSLYMTGKPFLIRISYAVVDWNEYSELSRKYDNNESTIYVDESILVEIGPPEDSDSNKKIEIISKEDSNRLDELSEVVDNRYKLLHEAARLGFEKCIDNIIRNLNVGVDENDSEAGVTALCFAAEHNQVRCLERLLSYGASLEHTDEFRATAISYAVLGGALESVEFLLKKGADASKVGDRAWGMLEERNFDDKTKEGIKNLIQAYKNHGSSNFLALK